MKGDCTGEMDGLSKYLACSRLSGAPFHSYIQWGFVNDCLTDTMISARAKDITRKKDLNSGHQ